jgi:hypothetical protein
MYRCYRDLDIIAVSLISTLPKQITNFRRNAIATAQIVFQLHIKHNSNCSHCIPAAHQTVNCSHCIPAAHQTQQQLLTLYSSCTSNTTTTAHTVFQLHIKQSTAHTVFQLHIKQSTAHTVFQLHTKQ